VWVCIYVMYVCVCVCVCMHGGIRSKSKIFVTWAFVVFANLDLLS